MTDEAAASRRIEELERKLQARDKTIAVLIERQLETRAHSATSLNLLEQNLALGVIVGRKTRELAQERTELATALAELKTTQARLLHAQKLESIGQLAAGIAHEINTPTQYVSDNVHFLASSLTPLLALLDQAESLAGKARASGSWPDLVAGFEAAAAAADLDYVRDQIPCALEQSAEGLLRIKTIVNAMKDFSHVSGASLKPEDLEDIIRSAVIVSQNEWKHLADLTVEIAPNLPAVPCLRDRIGQLVINLVVNAAHAISDRIATGALAKGQITITVGVVAGAAELRVTDNGMGIPEKAREHVFDPFFTTKAVGKGTGQGLAMAYATVVESHLGQIAFETEVGHGTCFTIRLPLEAADGEN
jgi:signal transduction histidine kinase